MPGLKDSEGSVEIHRSSLEQTGLPDDSGEWEEKPDLPDDSGDHRTNRLLSDTTTTHRDGGIFPVGHDRMSKGTEAGSNDTEISGDTKDFIDDVDRFIDDMERILKKTDKMDELFSMFESDFVVPDDPQKFKEMIKKYAEAKQALNEILMEEVSTFIDNFGGDAEETADIADAHAPEELSTTELTEAQKETIIAETGWSSEIVDCIKNMKQYEILKNAGLIEAEINGRKCLIKEKIDLDYTDADGVSNRDRIMRGLAPLDSKTNKPLELHHLGQKADSPLVELTEEEHRTGEDENGKKNQSLWHDNTLETEVHGEGNTWDHERKAHWKARAEMIRGE